MTLPFDIHGGSRDGITVRVGDLVFDVRNIRDVSAAAHRMYATYSDRHEVWLELHLVERFVRSIDATPAGHGEGVWLH